MIALWDVFPVSRRLQMIRGHSDSVLTWTGGGKRLASGALDGSVMLWSVSTNGEGDNSNSGLLTPIVSYGGLCNPYRLVAVGRCLAFTSSTAPTVTVKRNRQPSHDHVHGGGGSGSGGGDDGGNDADGLPLPASKGAHISVIDVEPPSMIGGHPECGRVSTGLPRLQHLIPGPCLGALMLSYTESWTEESDSDSSSNSGSAGDLDQGGGPAFLGGGRVTFKPPRLCRLDGAASVPSFRSPLARRSEPGPCCEDAGGNGGGGCCGGAAAAAERALEAKWVKLSRDYCSGAPWRHDDDRGLSREYYRPNSRRGNRSFTATNDDDDEDVDGGAFCTCATFVGRTLFLGYDTGEIWAHRAFNGRRLYRLSTSGSVVHLLEAEGALYAYASSGIVSRWSWGR
ncbi:unnamed protein product [Hapterophycus canaliculatus]